MQDPEVMTRCFLFGCALVAFGSLYACAATGPPQTDMCRKQIKDYVAQQFDQTVTGIRLQYADPGGRISDTRASGTAVVFVEECDGYHAFELFATYTDCETRAYYGNPSNLIRYRVSAEGC